MIGTGDYYKMPVLANFLESHYLFQGIAVALTLIFVSNFYRELADGLPYREIPLVGRSRWEISNTKAKKLFVTSAKDLMVQGFSQVWDVPCPLLERRKARRYLRH